jgi:hypothetical protein
MRAKIRPRQDALEIFAPLVAEILDITSLPQIAAPRFRAKAQKCATKMPRLSVQNSSSINYLIAG